MKHLLSLFFLSMLAFGCTKSNTDSGIFDKWRLVETSGGIGGGGFGIPFRYMELKENCNCLITNNDDVIDDECRFDLLKEEGKRKIKFYGCDPFFSNKLLYYYVGDTLTLSEEAFDGFNFHFIRE